MPDVPTECLACKTREGDYERGIGEEVFGEQSPAEGGGFCKAEKGT